MSHQVIARRYRPLGFEAVVGQDSTVRALRGALDNGRLGAAYLFSGTRGVGKTTCARILAKCFNCRKLEKPGALPCGDCPACTEIAEGRAMDVLEIDAASHTQVEKMRELLAGTQYAPARDRYKIIILDEVHMLSNSSFNALLKTLEEPPAHLIFILATTNPDDVPVTIRSRCLHFVFRPIAMRELVNHLKVVIAAEGSTASEAAVERMARAAGGSLRDAQSLLEQLLALGGGQVLDADVEELTGGKREELARRYLAALPAGDAGLLLDIIDDCLSASEEPAAFAAELLKAARDLLVDGVRGKAVHDNLKETAAFLSGDRAALLLDLLLEQEFRSRKSGQPRAVLEAYVFRFSRLADLVPLEALLGGAETGNVQPRRPPPAAVFSGGRAVAPAVSTPTQSPQSVPNDPIPALPSPVPAPVSAQADFCAALAQLDAIAAGYIESARLVRDGARLDFIFPATRRSSQKKMAKEETVALLLRVGRQLWPELNEVRVMLQGESADVTPAIVTGNVTAATACPTRAGASEPTPTTAPRTPMADIRNHPQVRRVIETLDAELLTVKPPKPPAPERDEPVPDA